MQHGTNNLFSYYYARKYFFRFAASAFILQRLLEDTFEGNHFKLSLDIFWDAISPSKFQFWGKQTLLSLTAVVRVE